MRGQPARPVRAGGMEKRAGSNLGTALHADPTTMWRSSTSRAAGWPAAGCLKAWWA
jgi:hypothetical protein